MRIRGIGADRPRRRLLTPTRAVVLFSVLGVVSGIAVPNLPRFRAHARQFEARAHLLKLYGAEVAHFTVTNSYTESIAAMDYAVPRGNRYTFVIGAVPDFTGTLRQDEQPDTPAPTTNALCADAYAHGPTAALCAPARQARAGVIPGPAGGFLATAAANLDHDATLDEWSVSSEHRVHGPTSSDTTCASGDAPAGEPCHDVDDITQ